MSEWTSTMGLLFGNFYLTRERRSSRVVRSQGAHQISWNAGILRTVSFGETDGDYPCELPDPSCHALASACGRWQWRLQARWRGEGHRDRNDTVSLYASCAD